MKLQIIECLIYFAVPVRRLHWKHNKKKYGNLKFKEGLHNNCHKFKMGRQIPLSCITCRKFSTLSHVDETGKASMVDVGSKEITQRIARARGFIYVGGKISKQIAENGLKKGDVLAVSQLAGIMAAKKTSDLIPLCHPLSLNYVNVWLKLNDNLERIEIISEVRCTGKTGVEMEALTAVSIAALTIYDMCKAAGPPDAMKISGIELLSKCGGKRDFVREEPIRKSSD